MTWDLDGLGNHEVKGRGEHMTWDLGGLGTRGAWPVAIFGDCTWHHALDTHAVESRGNHMT